MQQNIHLLTNSSYGLPNDIWVPATRDVPPQRSQQLVCGYNVSFKENKYETSIEFIIRECRFNYLFRRSNILGTNFSSWEDRIDLEV